MIYIGIGSNLTSSFGNRFKNIELAISFLQEEKIKLIKKSSFYETPSYPNKENPKFINVVIEVSTNLTPAELASTIILVEEKLGRVRNKKNDPRTCDIDIIDFYSQIINFKYNSFVFSVPHEKLCFRNFVLFPLNEILPEWKHPKTKEKVSTLITKLTNEDRKSILKVKKN